MTSKSIAPSAGLAGARSEMLLAVLQRFHMVAIATSTVVVIAAIVLIVTLTTGGPGEPDQGFDGAPLPAVMAPAFTLFDQAGRPVSPSSYRGQVTMLVFLHSTCTTACVLVGEQIRGALDELGRDAPPTLLISDDPAADTQAHVMAFLAKVKLAGRVRYLAGATAQLQPVWRAYQVLGPRPLRAAEPAYTVLLLDAQVRERVAFPLEELTPEGLVHDIRLLRTG
jgi:protein SCO1